MRIYLLRSGLLVACLLSLVQCASRPAGYIVPGTPHRLPEIINVSAYDPKERQRPGRGFSVGDVSALRDSGAQGLIARVGRGANLDDKCASFLTSADRVGLLPGIYHRLQTNVDAGAQADLLVNRARELAHSRAWNASSLLLCGDFDAHNSLSDILRFIDRVEARTGIVPVAYLENSTHLKLILSNADAASKARLRRAPYWLALYSHDGGGGPVYPAPGDPAGLVKQYGLWPTWALWQYGGVEWERRASRAKVYNHGSWRFPLYFGSLDRPTERNVFNGSSSALHAFWKKHGLPLK